jgi:hypothetical protein
MEYVSLQNKHDVIQPFISAKKKTEGKNKDAPRKTHSNTYATVATSSKSSMQKNSKRKRSRGKCK